MSLTFEKEINLTEYADNPAPKIVEQLAIVHESRDGDITQYYIVPDTMQAGDKESRAIGIYHERTNNDPAYYTYDDYDELIWSTKGSSRLTRQRITRLGAKAFPNVGAIAHYKLAYRNISIILAPVNYAAKRYKAPVLSAEIHDTYIHFTITPPNASNTNPNDLIEYQVYRICMQWNQFTLEYVTYDLEYDAPLPSTTGTYSCWVVGYVNEGEAGSFASNILELEIQGTRPDWPNVTPGSEDIYITALHFNAQGYLEGTLTNGATVTSDNKVDLTDIYLTALHFNNDGYLEGTLSNTEVVTADNKPSAGPSVGIPMWRVLFYDASGNNLLNREYVANGDDCLYGAAFEWATSIGGEEVPGITQDITQNLTLYKVSSIAMHIWTKSTGGNDAAMYVQEGTYDNGIFTPSGEAVSVVYTSVDAGDPPYDCGGIATLAYTGISVGWQVKATSNISLNGLGVYTIDDEVKSWTYSTSVDFIIAETTEAVQDILVRQDYALAPGSCSIEKNGNVYTLTFNNVSQFGGVVLAFRQNVSKVTCALSNNSVTVQYGRCTKTATLPSIISSGSGRVDYTTGASQVYNSYDPATYNVFMGTYGSGGYIMTITVE